MPTPDEIRRMNLERDQIVQLNRAIPGGGSRIVVQPWNGRDKVRAVAERGHREDGCSVPADWCPYCELLEILSQ